MAVTTDPLRRDAIAQVASPGARLAAPGSNAALELAQSLAQINPEARATLSGIADRKAEAERARAKRDALEASGAKLADAVREGKLRPTQNPWYVQAYDTESAAIRGQNSLAALQEESLTWEERDDAQAFAKRWRESVAEVSKGFEGKDAFAGFSAVEAQVTQQTLATNQAQNAKRIENERVANLGQLGSEALTSYMRASGGKITPNAAFTSLLPVKQQWFATGGDQLGWENLLKNSLISAARQAQDPTILDLAKAPELLYGPSSAAGEQRPGRPGYAPIKVVEVPASADQPAKLKAEFPKQTGFSMLPVEGAISSRFGTRGAPISGASTDHKGVDIAVPVGTPVKAPAGGRVVSVGSEGKGGAVVRIDHGGGVVSAYAHLKSSPLRPGDLVSAGDTIASSGRSGNVTGPHLHYSLRVGGKAVNPLTFKGEVGGAVEGEANGRPMALSGFPGQDQPYDAASADIPQNQFGAGPSLYNRPGVAGEIDQEKYYIGQAAENAPVQRVRILQQQRKAQAFEALDGLYAKYGTGLLTGDFDRDTLIQEMNKGGYSAPVIAQVFNELRGQVTDSAALQDARVAARSGTSQRAISVMDLALRAQKEGYSEAYEAEVRNAILDGSISADDGQSMITNALSRSRGQAAEARAEASAARAEAKAAGKKPGSDINSASELKAQADNYAALIVQKALQHPSARYDRKFKDERWQKSLSSVISQKMKAWLGAHPGDYEGALAQGRAAAAAAVRSLMGETGAAPKPAGQPAPSGANQRPSSSSNPRS